jgi:spore coat polysaccharide biosynthesis protein SpsF (cytidylyltransferase family)
VEQGGVRARPVAIIQARTSSTRLPGKTLAPIAGQAAILFMCARVRRARSLEGLCVATSVDPSDDPLAAAVEGAGITLFRGSLDDVLERFAGAARACGAEQVVRLTGDCPLVDPDLVDRAVGLLADGYDYASNTDPPSYPDGLDVEAMTMTALEEAAREATLGSDREHVTPFIRNRPERFKAGRIEAGVDMSALRWTVDYPDDLDLVRRLADGVGDPILADRFDFLRVHEALGLGSGAAHERNEGLAASLARDAAQRGSESGPSGAD